jgi:oxygen-independent coproporphyrinogen-3 oxidase
MKTDGRLVAPVADWDTKRRWVDYAFRELERAGYTVGSAYTAVKDKARTRFVYRDYLWAGADLLSIGVASFGHINGTHYQNVHDFQPYTDAVSAGRFPVFRALTPQPDERYIREFILQLKLGSVSADYFTRKFGEDPRVTFAGPLQTLKDWGFLQNGGDRIGISREGLLQVDRLLHEFFKAEHRTGRYA